MCSWILCSCTSWISISSLLSCLSSVYVYIFSLRSEISKSLFSFYLDKFYIPGSFINLVVVSLPMDYGIHRAVFLPSVNNMGDIMRNPRILISNEMPGIHITLISGSYIQSTSKYYIELIWLSSGHHFLKTGYYSTSWVKLGR